MGRIRAIASLLLLLTAGLSVKAQQYRNDFENRYTWYPPWYNIVIATDSTSVDHGYVCECDSTREFGLGFNYQVHDTLRGRNLRLQFSADYRFPDTVGTGDIVLSITQGTEMVSWNSYHLAPYANDSAGWFHFEIDLNLPADCLSGSTIKSYLWNHDKSRILIDNAELSLTPWRMPSFLPLSSPITEPGMVVEYILENDTLSEYHPFIPSDTGYISVSAIDTTFAQMVTRIDENVTILLFSNFYRDCQLLRQALVIPFADSCALTVYRRNMLIDTADFQPVYYLDREGFKVGSGDSCILFYHQPSISSTQFDAEHRTAWFNLDYWRDHPMIHYPLNDSLENHFEDISSRRIFNGEAWYHGLMLNVGKDPVSLPRIMPVPYGYESGIIFTEHADWTDLRTHRAVYFGSEKITKARNAEGGFVYYGIPVTKSVFFNNPDHVTNETISNGAFTDLHATLKGDRKFERFLIELDRLGYEICLHTPEQYTTTKSNLEQALSYMRLRFKSASWIDHGYNNGSIHNREDLVCDALDRDSKYYAVNLWRRYGIRYLWNAYYEENRPEQWFFDNNLLQPYPGFGDAFPNRQITGIHGRGYDYWPSSLSRGCIPVPCDFLLWSTPSTLDITSNSNWDYYYSQERLQRIVDYHSVHITHMYPAWVWPGRTFWIYDADSTIVAMPGMNEALQRIATLRDEHKMLPMTVQTYLDYYSGLNQVVYEIIDDDHIELTNNGGTVKGFTLLCPSPIRFEDNRYYEFRKSGNAYYIWFDLKPYEKVNIKIVTPHS